MVILGSLPESRSFLFYPLRPFGCFLIPVCKAHYNNAFIDIGRPRRVWSVSAIHGEVSRLVAVHDYLMDALAPGDRIIYHGNYSGYGAQSASTIDEILTFRRLVLAMPGMKAGDLVYLRGGQEEMLQKLLYLQYAPKPVETLLWMLGHGMSATLESYGHSPHEGIVAAQEGIMPLGRWTAKIRDSIRRAAGHEIFSTHLHRAAYVMQDDAMPILFVNAGIDPARALDEQGDHFWWTDRDFNAIDTPYSPFEKVIRGYDPRHRGLHINCVTATIDGGCGFGGRLVCAGFGPDGDVFDAIEA